MGGLGLRAGQARSDMVDACFCRRKGEAGRSWARPSADGSSCEVKTPPIPCVFEQPIQPRSPPSPRCRRLLPFCPAIHRAASSSSSLPSPAAAKNGGARSDLLKRKDERGRETRKERREKDLPHRPRRHRIRRLQRVPEPANHPCSSAVSPRIVSPFSPGLFRPLGLSPTLAESSTPPAMSPSWPRSP